MALPNTMNAGVFPTEWATKLQERLDYPLNWKMVCNVIYSDLQVFNVPYMSTEPAAQDHTRGCSYGFGAFALTNDTLTITTGKIAPMFINRADAAQCTLLRQMDLADLQGKQLNEAVESAWLTDLASNATNLGLTNGVITSGSTGAITVDITNIGDLIRGLKRVIRKANGQSLMGRNGLFIVWDPERFELLEKYAQNNGVNTADTALKNGVDVGFNYMGVEHYVSNSLTSGHLAGGVKNIYQIGILKSTYGQVVITQDPASGVSTYGPVSGIGVVSQIDYGFNIPTNLVTMLYDIYITA